MKTIDLLKKNFLEIKEAFENGEDDEQLVYDLDEEIQDAYDEFYEEKEINQLNKLNKEFKVFKREYNFYDEEAELDRMFPDRHEEGFDEDSMS
jgi:hypothetical protein